MGSFCMDIWRDRFQRSRKNVFYKGLGQGLPNWHMTRKDWEKRKKKKGCKVGFVMALLHWKRDGKGFRSGLGSRVGWRQVGLHSRFHSIKSSAYIPTTRAASSSRNVAENTLQKKPKERPPSLPHKLKHSNGAIGICWILKQNLKISHILWPKVRSSPTKWGKIHQTPVIVHSTTKYTATLWSDRKACVTVSARGRAENLAQNPLLYCLNWNSGLYMGWGFLQCCYFAELLVCTFYALLYFLSVRRGLLQPITVWQNLYLISLQVTSPNA